MFSIESLKLSRNMCKSVYNALSDKTSCFCARSGGSLYLGFVMLFECRYSYFLPHKNFNKTWNQNLNLLHLPLGDYLLWVYRYMISVSTRTAVSLIGKTEKKGFFPPNLLLVKEFAHIVDPINNLKTFF